MTSPVPGLTTSRLVLRPWRDDDLAPFAALNADPRVMEFFPAVLSRAESDGPVARIRRHVEAHGFGLWAVEVPGVAPFIGFVGLMTVPPALPFSPAVEVGWRLAHEHWGRGYATEAGRAAVEFGFGVLGVPEIVSFTAEQNRPSRAVMERLGMTHSPADDFEHPSIPAGHALRRHVLYRLRAP
ncbi:MAG TPA: GNAT family N-acetyltransferase [Longimicrobium sp.]|jgi:ribosomal-protein-alanine N-acetyltransferase|uniref:GNAT family N-acetyltransferase n=1 Tax=Longimicrobium sp. TaxID=2029185 RepID=UPI002EDB880E